MLTYKTDGAITFVYLCKKQIGTIEQVEGGYQYVPKGRRQAKWRGDVYATLAEVKRSLEIDEEDERWTGLKTCV